MSQSVSVTETTFQAEVIAAPVPVLVDFWADWCGPCKALAPVLDKLAAEFDGRLKVAKVNVDEEQQLAAMAGIRSLPTMLLFVNGQPVEQIVGAQPEANIRAVIEQHIGAGAPADPAPDSAALEDGSGTASLDKLAAILAENPDNVEAKTAMAKIHVTNGDLTQATELLDTLSEDDAKGDPVVQVRSAIWFAEELASLEDQAALDTEADTQYRAGIRSAVGGDHDAAAAALLEVLQQDRKYSDDAGRRALIKLMELLTAADPRVAPLRQRMMTLIY